MPLPITLLRELATKTPAETWSEILNHVGNVCAAELPPTTSAAVTAVGQRDRRIADVDLFLAGAGWELWSELESCAPHASDTLAYWWQAQQGGRAVLILDGLSPREMPWLLQGACSRGYTVHSAKVLTAELPPDTNSFARALGFAQRSALENNGAGTAHRLPGARTDTVKLPFKDCVGLVGAEQRWVLWHHWPDDRLHQLVSAGQGLNPFLREVSEVLKGSDFWALVSRLTTGRRLVITSDHGYGDSGLFADAPDDQAVYLKQLFKSGRSVCANSDGACPWVPPVSMTIKSRHGINHYAVGRRKWKSQGGYPTLVHGGLSVLEAAVPFIEISRVE